MFSIICPVCKTKFYKEDDSVLREYNDKKSADKEKKKIVRTSTPVKELEESPSLSFSDSVSEFFYQSWKSGLELDHTAATTQGVRNNCNNHPCTVLQPVLYAPQIVCVNTVIYQQVLPTVQQVGYRTDGTYGLLSPTYWQ